MKNSEVVSREQWLEARIELLKKEKEFTKLREELTQKRLDLPRVLIEKEYTFKDSEGEHSLKDLFKDQSQLIIYHFMFHPDWEEGCKVCSMFIDHYQALYPHLLARDVQLTTASRAPLEKIESFKKRMGWDVSWYSSSESDFNWDFGVSFTQEQLDTQNMVYNYQKGAKFPVTEAPGISSFYKDADGNIYHTYSSFGRGLENFLGIYNFLDIAPKGRDEAELPYPMAWVRHRDKYDDESFIDPYL